MLVYCSSALFNKLMFWGLYWHLTAWLELMWLNSWKNTMGCLCPLPEITEGEEGLVNKYLSWFIVCEMLTEPPLRPGACSPYLSKPRQSVWADFRAFLCVWEALVSEGSEAAAALFSGEECTWLQAWFLCQAYSKTFAFLARVSDLAVPHHSLPIKAERFLSQWKVRLLLIEVLNKIFSPKFHWLFFPQVFVVLISLRTLINL